MVEVSDCSMEEGWTSNNEEMGDSQGLEDINLSDENESYTPEEENVNHPNVMPGCNFDPEHSVNGVEDLWKINPADLRPEDVMSFHFADLGVAFVFYNWYASMHGFSARKSKVMRNSYGEITQQIFVCHREGHREAKKSTPMVKKREPKALTRCGCEARCKVHVEGNSGRWYIKYMNDVHNHKMLDDKYTGMLPAHRKLTEYDKTQMNTMKTVGIKTPHMYGVFACQAGGYQRVRFRRRDLYNEQLKGKPQSSDAKAALDFLEGLRRTDDMMFVRHVLDDDGRLLHLFWCDGISQRDFSVFGDVIAFDATYKKNKYMCPVVVFSGVNHHNQSIVFATAIVGNETEETYTWLLQQFLEAMGGKSPVSVITDGDVAMRNAIKSVWPNAHHRLCVWHLLRNATSNIKNPKFVSRLKQCMMGDYDLGEFKRKWEKLVADFGVQDNNWVKELYEKRSMWATAIIRGNFFAGFRTTSRCEGLHSEFGKFVNVRNNLLDFLQHFTRWLSYLRFREVEADFASVHGDPVMQTQFKCLEKFAADIYTKELFMIFRSVLVRACTCNVVGVKETGSCWIFIILKYRREGLTWRVSYSPDTRQFFCSCQRFESFGMPCEHLVAVLVHLGIVVLPKCMVLDRWTKGAKDSLGVVNDNMSSSRDPALVSAYCALVESCKLMAVAAVECGRPELLRNTAKLVAARTEFLNAIGIGDSFVAGDVDPFMQGTIRNPVVVRTKGCGGASSSTGNKATRPARRRQTCSLCGGKGHNRNSCTVQT